MKRNKHILINVDENLFNMIQFLSDKDRRKISEYVFLLVHDEVIKRIPEATLLKDDGFKPLEFK